MNYARQTAMAGAVLLGVALGARAQETSTEQKGDDAPPAKSASGTPSKSAPSREQRPGRPGYRTGNDAPQSTTATENDTKQTNDKNKNGSDQTTQRREPIDPTARTIQFSFVKEPWENVMEWIAELSGLSLQMEVVPQGTFNYINDPNKYTLAEAIDVLNSQLIPKGLIIIRKGTYLKLLPLKEVPPDLIPRISPDDLDKYGESQFVIVLFPLQNISADTAEKEVKQFKSENGEVVAMESVNRLMVKDAVSYVRVIRDYLKLIEQQGVGLQSKTRDFPLKFVSALKVEAMLRELFTLPPKQSANQQSQRSDRNNEDLRDRMRQAFQGGGGGMNPFMMFGGGMPGGDPRGGDSRGGDSRGGDSRGGDSRGGDFRGGDSRGGERGSQSAANQITLSVDEPHNRLFVIAPPTKLAIIEDIIKKIDVPREGQDPFKTPEPQEPTVRPYRLSDGNAQSLSTALTAIYQNTPGVRFSADPENNMVIAIATPDDQKAIAKLVQEFEYDERNSVVLSLQILDAGSMETLLNAMYASGQRDWRTGTSVPRPGQPRVVADRSRNQLMVR